jgi:glucose/arabinose dehydrogenase
MSMRIRRTCQRLAIAAGLLATAGAAMAQTLLTTTRVASGLNHPLCIAHAPGDANRLFILEQGGRIRILNLATGVVNPVAFVDISGSVATNWLEYGLLGIAFHPNYQTNGFFYINYNPNNLTVADTLIARYHVSANPDVADPASATTILRFGYGTRTQHRAGWMDFGPDGYLYLTTGDGAESDPDNAAQNTTILRGKLLRLDVNGPDGIPGTPDDDGFPADANKLYCIPQTNPFFGSATNAQEIWAYGLRNAWRCSFDRLTGDLWIGDVGQATREEVDFQPAGAPGGRNYGWRCTEGTICTGFTGCTCNSPTLTAPVYEYAHTIGLSVTGGYVYRGCVIPDLRGTYVFGDYQMSKMFSFRYNGTVTNYTDRTAELAPGGGLNLSTPSALGEDLSGELYICDYGGGEVFKIVPRTTPPPGITITQQPSAVMACAGLAAQLSIAATSTGSPATYLWRRNGSPLSDGALPSGSVISGAATASLTISNIHAAESGSYSCLVTNLCTSLATNAAALSVNSADFDNNGDSGADADIEAFFACLAGNCCATCGSADFNADGDTGTDADIEAFFRVLAGSSC